MIIGHNTSQAMGKGVLDTFMPHPGFIPGPGGSKNGCFWGVKNQPKWQGAMGAMLEEIFNLETG